MEIIFILHCIYICGEFKNIELSPIIWIVIKYNKGEDGGTFYLLDGEHVSPQALPDAQGTGCFSQKPGSSPSGFFQLHMNKADDQHKEVLVGLKQLVLMDQLIDRHARANRLPAAAADKFLKSVEVFSIPILGFRIWVLGFRILGLRGLEQRYFFRCRFLWAIFIIRRKSSCSTRPSNSTICCMWHLRFVFCILP